MHKFPKQGRAVLNQLLRKHATGGSKERLEYEDAERRHKASEPMKEHEHPYWGKGK